MVDACKVGLCSFYDSGSATFGLVVGIAIGVGLILWLRRRKNRSDDD